MAKRQIAHFSRQIVRTYSNATTAQVAARTEAQESTSAHIHIKSVEPYDKDNCFKVRWNDGTSAKFSYLWLRDSAPNQRPGTINELSMNVKPVSWHLDQSGNELIIDWPPWTHNVHYSSKWLKDHTTKAALAATDDPHELHGVRKFQWASEKAKAALFEDGIVEIGEAGMHGLEKLIDDAKTHCGTHTQDLGHYSALHTGCPDLPTIPRYGVITVPDKYDGQQGVLQFVDGWEAAGRMRHSDPHSFEVLRKYALFYNNIQGEETSNHPIIELYDPLDEELSPIAKVVFNYSQRSTTLKMSNGMVARFYTALKTLHETCQKMAVDIPVEAGSMIVFDNWRILHGNTAFVTSSANTGIVKIDYYK